MNSKQFLNGNNLRKLNTQTRLFLESSRSYKTTREIFIREKSFSQIDILSGRRNNVSSAMQVIDKLIQVNSLYWLTGTRWKPTLYINAACNTSHGFGSKNKVLLVFKNYKNKKDSISLFKSWDREDFLKDFPHNLLRIEKNDRIKQKSWDVQRRYEKMIIKSVSSLLYSSMCDLERGRIPNDLKSLCLKFGCTLLEAIPYTHKFEMFGIEGVKVSKYNIKLAIKNTSTYCSLPSILEIIYKKSETKLINLSDLNIETRGYYDHSENLKIRPEQLKAAKKLQNEFKRIGKGL